MCLGISLPVVYFSYKLINLNCTLFETIIVSIIMCMWPGAAAFRDMKLQPQNVKEN